MIFQPISPGTIIMSDEWRAFRCVFMNSLKILCFSVNRSHWFILMLEQATQTQHHDRSWAIYNTTIWWVRRSRARALLKDRLFVVYCDANLNAWHILINCSAIIFHLNLLLKFSRKTDVNINGLLFVIVHKH